MRKLPPEPQRKPKILCTSKISQNWQTTVQREARAVLGAEKGDELEWILKKGEVIVRKKAS